MAKNGDVVCCPPPIWDRQSAFRVGSCDCRRRKINP
jgi:hypothetical protein